MEEDGNPKTQHDLPHETYASNLGFASEYMEAARKKYDPPEDAASDFVAPSYYGAGRSPSRSLTPETPKEPANVASIEKIFVARRKTGAILDYYEKFRDVNDANCKRMCGVASELEWTLFYLARDLSWDFTSEGDPTFGSMILELQQFKVRLEKLLQQVLKENSTGIASRASRPASVVYSVRANGERRASWTCSFRQHISLKVMHSIEELKHQIESIIDVLHSYVSCSFPVTLHKICKLISLLKYRDLDKSGLENLPGNQYKSRQNEKAYLNATSFSQDFGSSKICDDCSKMFDLRETWHINLKRHEFSPKIRSDTSVKKLYEATKNGCQFCRIHHARLLSSPSNYIWKIAHAKVNWWKFWAENGTHQKEDDCSSFSLSKDFGVTYYSSSGTRYPNNLFVTKDVSKQEAGTSIILLNASRLHPLSELNAGQLEL